MFQSLYAILELKEHIQPNDHDLLQIGVSNLRIEEVLACESAKRLLEGIALQTADVNSGDIILCLDNLVSICSHESSERLVRDIDVQGWYCIH